MRKVKATKKKSVLKNKNFPPLLKKMARRSSVISWIAKGLSLLDTLHAHFNTLGDAFAQEFFPYTRANHLLLIDFDNILEDLADKWIGKIVLFKQLNGGCLRKWKARWEEIARDTFNLSPGNIVPSLFFSIEDSLRKQLTTMRRLRRVRLKVNWGILEFLKHYIKELLKSFNTLEQLRIWEVQQLKGFVAALKLSLKLKKPKRLSITEFFVESYLKGYYEYITRNLLEKNPEIFMSYVGDFEYFALPYLPRVLNHLELVYLWIFTMEVDRKASKRKLWREMGQFRSYWELPPYYRLPKLGKNRRILISLRNEMLERENFILKHLIGKLNSRAKAGINPESELLRIN